MFKSLDIQRFNAYQLSHQSDQLAVEEPLEIKLGFGKANERQQRSLAVTMRTPGQDKDLVLGFLFSEGIIASFREVLSIRFIGNQLDINTQENIILVDLQPHINIDFEDFSRHFYTSSSCGICGKTSIDMVQKSTCFLLPSESPIVQLDVLYQLPEQLHRAQTVFEYTGGIHAAGLFTADGQLLVLKEDVGRHNALDKLIGWALQKNSIPLKNEVLLLSGRASFELIQKALMAGIPILAAIGAPSSLAVELAEVHGMTLIGFLKKDRMNVYCGAERIVGLSI